MYTSTDKVIKYLAKQFIRLFGKFRALLPLDELNIIKRSKALYEELAEITEEAYLELAHYQYKKHVKSRGYGITTAWLLGILGDYNPVTKYVYANEVGRKRERFLEALIATGGKVIEVDRALRLWSQMANQYAIEVTDAVTIKAYKDDGVKRVVWVTTPDERRCEVCSGRDGVIYEIDKIPPKPHWNCRCYVMPWEDV